MMASQKVAIRALLIQMENSMVSCTTNNCFLPQAITAALFTSQAVQNAVLELDCEVDERIGLWETIYRSGRKLFAILILMRQEELIVKFRNANVLDDRLPLTEPEAIEIAGKSVATSLTGEFQWKLLPFRFPADMAEHHWEIDHRQILPFTEIEPITAGMFGDIAKVSILPPQQDFYPIESGAVFIIRKRLKSQGLTKEFKREKMCLRLLNQLRHPNIIPLLGSYTHQGHHYFLFPCANMDLKAFLQCEDPFGEFRHTSVFYSALRGLSSALSKLHRLHLTHSEHKVDFEAAGYHHDLRPANVLVTTERFLLADFGLGNLIPAQDAPNTPWNATTGDFLAPECMNERGRSQEVSRAIDVWAFGCLIAEVATYMQMGCQGVKRFSDHRLSPGRLPSWDDTMFYTPSGDVKPSVVNWLRNLGNDDHCHLSELAEVALQALTADVSVRPTIGEVCEKLTFLSLAAHFDAIKHQLQSVLDQTVTTSTCSDESGNHDPVSSNLWFTQQRFLVWGHALGLDVRESNYQASSVSSAVLALYGKSVELAADLLGKLTKWTGDEAKMKTDQSTWGDSDTQYMLEQQLDQGIEKLWDLLPAHLKLQAQDYWHQAILDTDDRNTLEDIHQRLRSRYTIHSVTDAMAMMRKIRVDILHPESFQGTVDSCPLPEGDVRINPGQTPGRHCFGVYKNQVPVLVEYLRQAKGWQAVHPKQRDLVIGLKAQSLNSEPSDGVGGLRTMNCLGAFQEQTDALGYGFVYRFPKGTTVDAKPSTLLERLNSGEPHPPDLGDRFKLAFALSDFLKELHTIGWLHEHINPHNVLFFNDGSLARPYIVGLNKSRPDGTFWLTDGPTLDGDLQDYQHPEYFARGRYCRAFDYYSLGIVLLEIGLWRPLKVQLSSKKFQTMGMAEIRQELIRRAERRLGANMGVVYRDVVVWCLGGGAEESRAVSSKPGQTARRPTDLALFTDAVIQPLQRLSNTLI
ncbi:kinase-like domain-containing protein [Podospora australis]|uniref:Kinase-like domain-containing protein n=1 Tax=Podospora australis TaxID=1536484 RepID=A0AAN6WIE8_9PEZI|nr:kinase-like domain-containing protein [Podospora australis]